MYLYKTPQLIIYFFKLNPLFFLLTTKVQQIEFAESKLKTFLLKQTITFHSIWMGSFDLDGCPDMVDAPREALIP